MAIKFDFKKKFIVNGKEYKSVEEMPEEIRHAFQNSLAGAKSGLKFSASTEIIFNGKAYKGMDHMPPDIRQTYEAIMKSAASSRLQGEALDGLDAPGQRPALKVISNPDPIEPDSFSLSLQKGFIVAALLALAAGAYFIFFK